MVNVVAIPPLALFSRKPPHPPPPNKQKVKCIFKGYGKRLEIFLKSVVIFQDD